MATAKMKKLALEPGARVLVVGKHAHQGTTGEAVSFGSYGPQWLEMVGWLVELDTGGSCYAKAYELQVIG